MLQKALFLRKSLFPFSYIRQYRILLPLMSSSSIMLTRSLYIRYGNVSLLMRSSFRLVARKTNLFNLTQNGKYSFSCSFHLPLAFPKLKLIDKHSIANLFTSFYATGLFLYLLETSENQAIFDVFRGYIKRPVT